MGSVAFMTGAEDTEGTRLDALRVLNRIEDPCGHAMGVRLGLVDMGIIAGVRVEAGVVEVALLPTYPGCLMVPAFHRAIEERLSQLEGCRRVEVFLARGKLWESSRLSPRAQRLLSDRRTRAFKGLMPRGAPPRGSTRGKTDRATMGNGQPLTADGG